MWIQYENVSHLNKANLSAYTVVLYQKDSIMTIWIVLWEVLLCWGVVKTWLLTVYTNIKSLKWGLAFNLKVTSSNTCIQHSYRGSR